MQKLFIAPRDPVNLSAYMSSITTLRRLTEEMTKDAFWEVLDPGVISGDEPHDIYCKEIVSLRASNIFLALCMESSTLLGCCLMEAKQAKIRTMLVVPQKLQRSRAVEELCQIMAGNPGWGATLDFLCDDQDYVWQITRLLNQHKELMLPA